LQIGGPLNQGADMGATQRVLRSMTGLLGAVGLGLAGGAWAAEGLNVVDPASTWPRWQARLDLAEAPGGRLGMTSHPDLAAPVRAAFLGDYDLGSFGLALPHTTGRFRATSGLLFGLRSTAVGGAVSWTGGANGPLPLATYVGVGYTGWLTKTGLSFSADLGLTANYPGGSWRFGRALFGNQGFDATLRELRLQPRLQLGVQYSY
jgi:hypothetical protein